MTQSYVSIPPQCLLSCLCKGISLAPGAPRLKPDKPRAPRNGMLTLMKHEHQLYRPRLLKLNSRKALFELTDKTIHQDLLTSLDYLPSQFIDRLFLDPPYNRNNLFNQVAFTQKSTAAYEAWLRFMADSTNKEPKAYNVYLYLWRLAILNCFHRVDDPEIS